MHLAVLALEAKILTNDNVTQRILSLVQSPLLQGAALKTLLQYFNTLVKIYPAKYKETARALTQQRIYRYFKIPDIFIGFNRSYCFLVEKLKIEMKFIILPNVLPN